MEIARNQLRFVGGGLSAPLPTGLDVPAVLAIAQQLGHDPCWTWLQLLTAAEEGIVHGLRELIESAEGAGRGVGEAADEPGREGG